uniref:Uncharacterized protein n=1 Tax=Oryza rufipogon TaxID=4529 RepID=A0A0E0PKG9_ORYRU
RPRRRGATRRRRRRSPCPPPPPAARPAHPPRPAHSRANRQRPAGSSQQRARPRPPLQQSSTAGQQAPTPVHTSTAPPADEGLKHEEKKCSHTPSAGDRQHLARSHRRHRRNPYVSLSPFLPSRPLTLRTLLWSEQEPWTVHSSALTTGFGSSPLFKWRLLNVFTLLESIHHHT